MGEKRANSLTIAQILSNNPKARSKALTQIYNDCFPIVKRYVTKNNGGLEAAKDIFQETITIVYHNLSKDKFRGESSLNKYVIGIARNLWLLKLRKKTLLTVELEGQQIITEEAPPQLDTHLITHVLKQLNQGCRSLLKSFYYDALSMEEIAKQQNLGSAQAAKTKKLRCMKKLAGIMKDHGLEKHHFLI